MSVEATARLRKARLAAALVFFVTGAVYATWATRIPAVQDRLHLSAGEVGLAILGLEAGAITGLPLGAALVARAGSRTSLRAGFAVYPAALVALAAATDLLGLALALAGMAAANSVVDVAMNAQGVELERRRRLPVLSGLQAGHPLGLVAGGLGGTAAAAAGVPVATHFALAAAIGAAAGLLATLPLVREAPAPRQQTFVRPPARLLLLGLVAFGAFLVGGAADTWSALHLRGEHGAGAALSAAGFTAYALALPAGRLGGDRLVARLGRLRVVQGGAVVAAAGSAIAVGAPSLALAFAGWIVLGLGLSVIAPAVIGAAPAVAGVPVPAAIAGVTTIGYLGSFTGPPLIGALAGPAGLSAALGMLVAVSLLMAALAPSALGRRA